jgi:DNA-binding CsgD family transcriptional regulator
MKLANEPTLADAFMLAEVMAKERKSPGVLVFTASLQLLYTNGEAREMSQRLHLARTERPVKGVLPAEVMAFCEELASALRTRSSPKDLEQLHRTHVTGAPLYPTLLHGFGIPHSTSTRDARLLILMEPLSIQSDFAHTRVQARYHLTDREQTIIIYLIQGLTNKEIGSLMEVSEHTVKEHLKHIMKKTHTTTRTGLLARIIFAAAASPAQGPVPARPKAVDQICHQSA